MSNNDGSFSSRLRQNQPRNPHPQDVKPHLDVDLVLPDQLLLPRGKQTDIEEVPHLVEIGKEDVSSHKEADTFGTWWGGKGSCLSVVFFEDNHCNNPSLFQLRRVRH